MECVGHTTTRTLCSWIVRLIRLTPEIKIETLAEACRAQKVECVRCRLVLHYRFHSLIREVAVTRLKREPVAAVELMDRASLASIGLPAITEKYLGHWHLPNCMFAHPETCGRTPDEVYARQEIEVKLAA